MTGGEMGKPSTSLQNKKIMEDILVLSPVDWGRIPRLAVLGFESHFGDCLVFNPSHRLLYVSTIRGLLDRFFSLSFYPELCTVLRVVQ